MSLLSFDYASIYYNIILFITIGSYLKIKTRGLTFATENYSSFFLLVFAILYMGFRPLYNGLFGDTGVYRLYFEMYASGAEITLKKDYYWHVFMKICTNVMNSRMFFLMCATLYTVPLYLACKKWFGKSMYIPFLMFIVSFSFWPYGTNGVRNGIATSIFVLGISYDKNKYLKILLFSIGFAVHASLIIPIAAFLITLLPIKPKVYLKIWILCIPLSLILGSFWESFFASLGFADERMSYLTDGNITGENFAYTGFRWDFVLYSGAAVYAGYYFIVKKKFRDAIYQRLFGVFIIANSFWILVIRANFSNRFAYLSWFLMAVVIFYPLFKKQFFKNQTEIIARNILLYFSFTYFMYLIT